MRMSIKTNKISFLFLIVLIAGIGVNSCTGINNSSALQIRPLPDNSDVLEIEEDEQFLHLINVVVRNHTTEKDQTGEKIPVFLKDFGDQLFLTIVNQQLEIIKKIKLKYVLDEAHENHYLIAEQYHTLTSLNPYTYFTQYKLASNNYGVYVSISYKGHDIRSNYLWLDFEKELDYPFNKPYDTVAEFSASIFFRKQNYKDSTLFVLENLSDETLLIGDGHPTKMYFYITDQEGKRHDIFPSVFNKQDIQLAPKKKFEKWVSIQSIVDKLGIQTKSKAKCIFKLKGKYNQKGNFYWLDLDN